MIRQNLSYRFVFFLLALFTYALFGSPTPDNPGVSEAVIGFGLILSARIAAFPYRLVSLGQGWQRALAAIFLYGFSVQLLTGFINANDVSVILRDVLAFLFVLAPLFFYPFLTCQSGAIKFLTAAILIIGTCFAVRALLPVYGFYEAPEELLYLANSPLVLLSVLLLLFFIWRDVFYRQVKIKTLLYFCLAVIPFAAMLIDVQRAPMAAVCLTMLLSCAYTFYVRPMRGLLMIAVLAVAGFALLPVFQDITHEMLSKTSRVGLNMRAEELRAVLDVISVHPLTALFGLGWGATFPAPSVGGLHVAYTHSLLSYFLLKGGFAGLGLMLAFCFLVLKKIAATGRRNFVLAQALFWPFIIPVFFYASHKSLDFGLVLLFILLISQQIREQAAPTGYAIRAGLNFHLPVLPKGAA